MKFFLNKKGQSLVLFVFMLPIFLAILALVIDFGNYFYEYSRLSSATKQASLSAVSNYVQQGSINILDVNAAYNVAQEIMNKNMSTKPFTWNMVSSGTDLSITSETTVNYYFLQIFNMASFSKVKTSYTVKINQPKIIYK